MSSSEVVPADDDINNIKVHGDVDKPRIQGGQDHNSQAQKRRDTVKGVRIFFISNIYISNIRARTTRIYLNRRVLRPIIRPAATLVQVNLCQKLLFLH